MHGWVDVLEDWPGDSQLGYNVSPTQLAPGRRRYWIPHAFLNKLIFTA